MKIAQKGQLNKHTQASKYRESFTILAKCYVKKEASNNENYRQTISARKR